METSDYAARERNRWKMAATISVIAGIVCLGISGYMVWLLFQLPIKGGPFVAVGDDAFGRFLSYSRKLALAPAGIALAFLLGAVYFRRRMRDWDGGL